MVWQVDGKELWQFMLSSWERLNGVTRAASQQEG
jgi:hypothetical protein